MGDEDTKKQHTIYGSAGMAAAGMIRTGKSKSRTKKMPDENSPVAENTPVEEPISSPAEVPVEAPVEGAVEDPVEDPSRVPSEPRR